MAILEQLDLAPYFESDEVGGLLITALVFVSSAFILARRAYLERHRRRADNGQWAADAVRIRRHLDEARPWLHGEFDLRDLAVALDMPANRVSAAIKQGLCAGFTELVGRLRLAEFRRLAADPSMRNRPILNLALDAGFSSMASFYRAFRNAHETTPTRWRASLFDPGEEISSQNAR